LTLLASLAFGTLPSMEDIFIEGIAHITPDDIRFASEFGFRIKLLGVARRIPDRSRAHGIVQRVQPVLVRIASPLAHVDGASNAVVADAGAAGRFFFAGRGAGEAPTAGAVIADLMDIARGDLGPAFGHPVAALQKPVAAPGGETLSAYYLRFEVLDQPGVLAEIAGYLSQARVSIESMIQRGRGEPVCIVMITHEASHDAVARALKAIAASDKVRARPCMIPMEAA
ncbi:MAG: ACT domain-containing protein, partial [Stellaceae bacterium]